MAEIRLYPFQSGTQVCKVHDIKMNQGHGEDFEIPVPWFLLTHPAGNVLIDGGLAVEGLDDPRAYWGDAVDQFRPVMSKEQGCQHQLAAVGIDARDIRYVVLSHLHADHTGAIGRFPNATHIVQRREYDYAFAPDWFAAGAYVRRDFDRSDLSWQFVDAEPKDSHDLFGDGVLEMIPTPGHSVGHQSFLIRLPNTGSILLAVDAAYTRDHWEEKALPGFLASTVDTVRSVRKLRALAARNQAIVVTGHDPEAWPAFLPECGYYD